MARSATPKRGAPKSEKEEQAPSKAKPVPEKVAWGLLNFKFGVRGFVFLVGLISFVCAIALYPVAKHVLGLVTPSELLNACAQASNPTVLALTVLPLGPARVSQYTTTSWGGSTCLHVVSSRGRPDLVEFLVDQGVNVNAVDNEGRTPLMVAASAGHASVVTTLGRNGAHPSVFDRTGLQSLHMAAAGGHRDATQAVLDLGVSADAPTSSGETALMLAARGSQPSAAFGVFDVLSSHGADVNRVEPLTGCSALHRAATHASPAAVRALLDAGADPNGPTGADCPYTPLTGAILQRRVSISRLLLERGASPQLPPSANGIPPLHAAALTGQVWLVSALRDAGASLTSRESGTGRTALHAAVLGAQEGTTVQLARLLMEEHASSERGFAEAMMLKDAEGATPAMRAAGSGEAGAVRRLLGVDVHTPAEGGMALIARRQRGEIAEAADRARQIVGEKMGKLLAATRKEQIEAVDAEGRSIFHYAAQGGALGVLTATLEAARLASVPLERVRQLVGRPDNLGRTPLYIAVDSGHCELALDRLVAASPQALQQPAHSGLNPVLLAALEGREDCISKLAALGADLNVTVQVPKGRSPSTSTTKKSDPESSGDSSSSSSSTAESRTPSAPRDVAPEATVLHLAALSGNVQALSTVLQRRADLAGARDSKGRTPLHLAALSGRLEAVDMFLNMDLRAPGSDGSWVGVAVDTGAVDKEGSTVLHLLAASPVMAYVAPADGHETMRGIAERIVGVLLQDNGQLLNAQDVNGRTPLHVACAVGNTVVAIALARAGAEPGIKDVDGLEAFDLAPADVVFPVRASIDHERKRLRAEALLRETQERDARRKLVESFRRRRLDRAREAEPRIDGLDFYQFEAHNAAQGYDDGEMRRSYLRYRDQGQHHLILLHTQPRIGGLHFAGFERHNMHLGFSREEFRIGWLNYVRGMHHRVELQGIPRRDGLDRAAFEAWNKPAGLDKASLDDAFAAYRTSRFHHLVHLQRKVVNTTDAKSKTMSAMLPESRRVGLRFEDFEEFNAGHGYTKTELEEGYARYNKGQLHLMHLQTDSDKDPLFAQSTSDILDIEVLDRSILDGVHNILSKRGIVPITDENQQRPAFSAIPQRIPGLNWQQFRTINKHLADASTLRAAYTEYLNGANQNIEYQNVTEAQATSVRSGPSKRVPGLGFLEFAVANNELGYDRFELETGYVRYVQGDHHFLLFQTDGGKPGKVKVERRRS